MEWDYICKLRLPAGLLFIPQMIYECWEPRWNDTDRGKPKNLKKELSQCHFVQHLSHISRRRFKLCTSRVLIQSSGYANQLHGMNERELSVKGEPWSLLSACSCISLSFLFHLLWYGAYEHLERCREVGFIFFFEAKTVGESLTSKLEVTWSLSSCLLSFKGERHLAFSLTFHRSMVLFIACNKSSRIFPCILYNFYSPKGGT
jgi:hypothetical protein